MEHRAVIRTVGVLLAGALGGALAATLMSAGGPLGERDARSHRPDPQGSAPTHPRDSRAELSRLKRDQSTLSQRLAELEGRSTEEDAGANDRPPAAPPSVPSPEQELKVVQARHEEWKALHAAEVRDATWAREEETAFNVALGATAERGGYKVVGVDCRTTLCTAELEWPSFTLASSQYAHALHVEVPGCESAILLEPPVDPSRPYRATARYDCEDARAGPPK